MPSLLASLVVSAVLLDGSLRLEGQTGSMVAGQPTRTGLLAGDIAVDVGEGAVRFHAGAAPQMLFADTGSGVVERAFVRARTAVELRGRDVWRVLLRQDGAYGSIDLRPLAGLPPQAPGPPNVQIPPAAPLILLEESISSASLERALSLRTQFSGEAAWQISGGADAASRASLPLSRGPRVRAQLSFEATRLDGIDGALSAFDTRYSNGRRASAAALTAAWRRMLSRGATIVLGAGPAVGRGEDPIFGTTRSALPAARAEARLEPEALGQRGLVVALRLAAEPVGDQISGDLTERGSMTASVGWSIVDEFRLDARALGSLALTSGQSGSFGTVAGDKFLQGELRLTFHAMRQVDALIGARGAWQSHPLGGFPPRQWGVFGGITFYPFRR
jgi:hypothetical protein